MMNSYNVYYHKRNRPQVKCKKCRRGILTEPLNGGTRWCPHCGAEHDRDCLLVEDSELSKTTRIFRK